MQLDTSLCQRRQPPEAGAEDQRLQRLVPPATIGPALGGLTTLDMPTIAYDAEWRTKVAGGNRCCRDLCWNLMARSPVESGYGVRQPGQIACDRVSGLGSASRRLCAL